MIFTLISINCHLYQLMFSDCMRPLNLTNKEENNEKNRFNVVCIYFGTWVYV